MYKRICNLILSWGSLVFLIIAFCSSISGITDFSLKTLFNTDGLTIIGIVIAFIMTLGLKIPFLKKIFLYLLLNLNFKNIDYKIQLNCISDNNIDTEDLFKYFKDTIKKSNNYSSEVCNLNINDIFNIQFFHRGMVANIKIKDITQEGIEENGSDASDNQSLWCFEIDGVSKFSILNKNIRYLMDYFLDDNSFGIHLDNMFLKMEVGNSEFDVAEFGGMVDRKKHPIISSRFKFLIRDACYIEKNKDNIILMAYTKGEFNEGFEVLKQILIS